MTDTAVISITGIVVSGVLGPTLAAYWSQRRAEVDRRAARADGDLQELRTLFAECLKLMLDARLAMFRLVAAVEVGWLDPLDPSSDDLRPNKDSRKVAEKALSDTQEILQVMLQEFPRLLLLLGKDHPVVDIFDENTGALSEVTAATGELVYGRLDHDAALDKIQKAHAVFTSTMAAFIDVCSPIATRQAE